MVGIWCSASSAAKKTDKQEKHDIMSKFVKVIATEAKHDIMFERRDPLLTMKFPSLDSIKI